MTPYETAIILLVVVIISVVLLYNMVRSIFTDCYDYDYEDCKIEEKPKKRKPKKGAIYE